MADLPFGTYYIVVLDNSSNHPQPERQFSGTLMYSQGVWTYTVVGQQPGSAVTVTTTSGSIGWTCAAAQFGFNGTFANGTYNSGTAPAPNTITGGTVTIGGTGYTWQFYSAIPGTKNYKVTVNNSNSDPLSGQLNPDQDKFKGQPIITGTLNLNSGTIGWLVTLGGTLQTYSRGFAYAFTEGGSGNQKYDVAFGKVYPGDAPAGDDPWMADSI
jgi:hypothetical protein